MIKIKFDRDSVCMADDIESHAVSFDVDENISIDDFISILYSKQNAIARIGGGKATWILQLINGSFHIDIAIFAEQWDTAKYLDFNSTIDEIIKYYDSIEFFAKYLAQKDPEIVYNTLKNPMVKPRKNVIVEKYKLFTEFSAEIKKLNPNFELSYCKDAKTLLGNILYKKKKICWFSVWNTGFKLVFYFTEKTIEDLYDLDINIDIKKMIKKENPVEKLIPVIIEVENKSKMKDGLKIFEYKSKLK